MTLVENQLTYEDICKPKQSWRRVFTTKLGAAKAKDVCLKMYATHSVISNMEEDLEYREFIKNNIKSNPEIDEECSFLNSGIQYDPVFILAQHKEEGEMETTPVKNPYTGEIISYINWFPGWPNGNFINKGGYWHAWNYNGGDSKFIHQGDDMPFCFSCLGKESIPPILRMRGLCEGSQFDKNYVLAQNTEALIFYQGDRHTNITFNEESEGWKIVSNRRINRIRLGADNVDYTVTGFSKVYVFIRRMINFPSSFSRLLLTASCLESQTSCLKAMVHVRKQKDSMLP